MSKLPQVTAREVLTVLKKAGFYVDRVKGSHHYLIHRGDLKRRTVVAMHPGDMPAGDIRSILKQAKISRNEFLELL